MKKIHLYSLVLFGFLCSHCSEAEDPEMACPVVAVSGPDDDVVGKWALVKVHTVFSAEGEGIADHSCDNTVYHFQQDGILTTSSDKEGFSSGTSSYELSQIPSQPGHYTLTIGNITYGCSISKSTMSFGNPALDGPVRDFVRIQ